MSDNSGQMYVFAFFLAPKGKRKGERVHVLHTSLKGAQEAMRARYATEAVWYEFRGEKPVLEGSVLEG